jgi:peroxisomal membrane protein 4
MIPESSSLPNDHVLKQLLILVKGFRNGLVYGAKIRFPHALVMSMLFREGRLGDKMRWVLMATKQHAWNLGRMAVIFKLMLFLLNWSFPRNLTRAVDLVDHDKMLEAPSVIGDWRPFVAGLVGGYLIFGTNDPINNQVSMLLSEGFSGYLIQWAC